MVTKIACAGIKGIKTTYTLTVYKQGDVEIRAMVNALSGVTEFEGYIEGRYVPFSRCTNISVVAKAVNRAIDEGSF